MIREKFSAWFFKALGSLIGKQGILFLINLIWVFFSWTFFVMVYFALDKMVPIQGFEPLYQNKLIFIIGSLVLFIITLLLSSWTYWDAYVRLAKPDRRPEKPKPTTKPFLAAKKKPVFVSTHESEPIKKQVQPLEQPLQPLKSQRKKPGPKPGTRKKKPIEQPTIEQPLKDQLET